MRLLLKMDARDYPENGTVFIRNSARCIAIRDGMTAMVHSALYDNTNFQAVE